MKTEAVSKEIFWDSLCFDSVRFTIEKEWIMEAMLQVGVISTTHGVRGEVKVFPTTDTAQRFLDLTHVYLDLGKGELQKLEIQQVKFVKKFAVLKLKGLDDINEAEQYKGKTLWIPREEAQPLGEDEYYIGDLIGMDVVLEDESPFGVLKDVMETGANDVYIVETVQGKEVLLPAIGECIQQVDVEAGVMTIHLMDGLL